MGPLPARPEGRAGGLKWVVLLFLTLLYTFVVQRALIKAGVFLNDVRRVSQWPVA
jgi:hypothetical protein